MNTDQIDRAIRPRCKHFHGVYAANRLPRLFQKDLPSFIVANLDPSHKPGCHWVSIYIDSSRTGYYFDSFGCPPPILFRRYLDKYCISWTYNKRVLQSYLTYYCAHFVVYFVLELCRGNFKLFDVFDSINNDLFVHEYSCKLFK